MYTLMPHNLFSKQSTDNKAWDGFIVRKKLRILYVVMVIIRVSPLMIMSGTKQG